MFLKLQYLKNSLKLLKLIKKGLNHIENKNKRTNILN